MKNISKRTILTIIAVLVLAAGGAFALWADEPFGSDAPVASDEQTDNEEDGNGENASEGNGDDSGGRSEGGSDFEGTDGGGAAQDEDYDEAIQNDGEPTTSDSGLITLETPTSNGSLQSGDRLQGTSERTNLHYRITDWESGVIAQGKLTVRDGRFSSSVNIDPVGRRGSVEVFTRDPQTLREDNHVDIEVELR